MDQAKTTILHLSLIQGVGSSAIIKLLNYFGPEDLHKTYNLGVGQLCKIGLSSTVAESIFKKLQDVSLVEKEKSLAEKNNIKIITLIDPDYPELLRAIHLPPAVLYLCGLPLWKNTDFLAVVGARKAGNYAKRVISSLIPECVFNGFGLASGGAIGADSMAHRETLDQQGKTVAVLGSGLLCPYPYSNKKLFEEIEQKGGAVISPFPLNCGALPGNFPARNRIISGLSLGCLVVQAAEKSGALITAYCALEQNREVFAVPGCIDDLLSVGCHKLIQKGAKLVNSAEDIFDELQNIRQFAGVAGSATFANFEAKINKSFSEQRDIKVEPKESDPSARAILDFCVIPRAVDEIVEVLQKDVQDIYKLLSDLQFQGKLEQDFSGMWQKI